MCNTEIVNKKEISVTLLICYYRPESSRMTSKKYHWGWMRHVLTVLSITILVSGHLYNRDLHVNDFSALLLLLQIAAGIHFHRLHHVGDGHLDGTESIPIRNTSINKSL